MLNMIDLMSGINVNTAKINREGAKNNMAVEKRLTPRRWTPVNPNRLLDVVVFRDWIFIMSFF
jgi:hypothetical protein